MSTTNKLNTEPHCKIVPAEVVFDKKCIIFTAYIMIVCSLQLHMLWTDVLLLYNSTDMPFSKTYGFVILNIPFDGEWKVLWFSTSDTFVYAPKLLSSVIQSN